MFRSRVIIGLLVVLGLALSLGGPTLAQDPQDRAASSKPEAAQKQKPGKPAKPRKPGKPAKGRVTWTPGRIEQTVSPGQTLQVSASFVSSTDLQNVTLRISGGLGRVVTVSPARFDSIKANTPTTVTLTISMPAERAHSQGGNIKVRAGKRNVPASLKVKLIVPGTEEE